MNGWNWESDGEGFRLMTPKGDLAGTVEQLRGGGRWKWWTLDQDGVGGENSTGADRPDAKWCCERAAKVWWYQEGWADPRPVQEPVDVPVGAEHGLLHQERALGEPLSINVDDLKEAFEYDVKLGVSHYLDLRTGRVVTIDKRVRGWLDEYHETAVRPEREEDRSVFEDALEVDEDESERFLDVYVPTQDRRRDGLRDMESFAGTVTDPVLRGALTETLRGSTTFRFSVVLARHLREEARWRTWENRRLIERMSSWLAAHGVDAALGAASDEHDLLLRGVLSRYLGLGYCPRTQQAERAFAEKLHEGLAEEFPGCLPGHRFRVPGPAGSDAEFALWYRVPGQCLARKIQVLVTRGDKGPEGRRKELLASGEAQALVDQRFPGRGCVVYRVAAAFRPDDCGVCGGRHACDPWPSGCASHPYAQAENASRYGPAWSQQEIDDANAEADG